LAFFVFLAADFLVLTADLLADFLLAFGGMSQLSVDAMQLNAARHSTS
jgi:hypothetical protein